REICGEAWRLVAAARDVTLLAIGGGATMDLAKMIRHRPVTADFEALAEAVRGHEPLPALAAVDLVAVPTTAGTGSEVTPWATLWDMAPAVPRKLSLHSPAGFARAAIVDPACCLTCPPAVTRDSALDALSHALEAIWNRHASPATDALAVGAARAILRWLPEVMSCPASRDGREALSVAAMQAGLAFAQTQTALAHALSYDLTIARGVPHGLACALWLVTAWRLARGRSPDRDATLAQVFGPHRDGPEALSSWLLALGVDPDPRSHGIDDEGARVAAALSSPRGRNFIGAVHA
ncbi:MAG TPA: iron-containing alcohol dehydrogenase, partial [Burkholderiales bacterium]|nr:iron-containing alcohol dehydrogenase [Burkholderiales bacterium]